jgi:two-component system OmpR family sensor kinase
MRVANAFLPGQRKPRSLRLRLMLWYGTLLAISFGFFATFFLILTTNAIAQSVDSAVRAEASIATLDIQRNLLPTSPYWPGQLSLLTIDTDRDYWLAIVNLDKQGHLSYPDVNSPAFRIPVSVETTRAVLSGQTVWYNTSIDGEHVRVEAVPIYVPATAFAGKAQTNDATFSYRRDSYGRDSSRPNAGPVISALLVAKSLSDADQTLLLLRAFLLLSGLATFAGTLTCTWGIAAYVLRPLVEMAATARSIVASTASGTRLGKLNQRVRPTGGRDEMAQVVETFNEMLASLESATQTQRRFVADASHELRAPLTTIQGNLAFLQEHVDELPAEERRTMLADAHEETLRLTTLVEELLLLARADANTDTMPVVNNKRPATEENTGLGPVELDHAVLQLVRQLRRRLNTEGSQLKLEIGHIEPVRVWGDEESLRRVTLILLDNALKYTPSSNEKEPGRVTVSLERVASRNSVGAGEPGSGEGTLVVARRSPNILEGEHAVLRICDTGIGIDPNDLPHIFERFYRADRARTRHGIGLGLSIAQTLVEQLGGYITAESTPGKGSTFRVWLPLYDNKYSYRRNDER